MKSGPYEPQQNFWRTSMKLAKSLFGLVLLVLFLSLPPRKRRRMRKSQEPSPDPTGAVIPNAQISITSLATE